MQESVGGDNITSAKYEIETIPYDRIKREASYAQMRYGIGRHDDALYTLNESIPRSTSPLRQFNTGDQPAEDLTLTGKDHATAMADSFLAIFDPKNDDLTIMSSALTRARETAGIFLQEAKGKGFSVKIIATNKKSGAIEFIDPDEDRQQQRSNSKRGGISEDLFEKHGGRQIRTLRQLSLANIKQMLVEFIFHKDNYMNIVDPESRNIIPNEYRELWEQARNIIESDNKNDWGLNFLTYSEIIQQLFIAYRSEHRLDESVIPDITSAKDMYERNFRNLMRLMARYDKAIDEYEANNYGSKKMRVLGFGHENQLLYFLKREFNREGVDKSKIIGFRILKDDKGRPHFTACLPDNPDNPKEIKFPESPYKQNHNKIE